MRKPTSRVDATPIRVVFVTMDTHVASATERARSSLQKQMPGLVLDVHAASEFASDPVALDRCLADIVRADVIIAMMLFLEEHFKPILSALAARRDTCDALVCGISALDVAKLTRMGRFDMSASSGGALSFLKRLRGKRTSQSTVGADQMKMLRRLPKLLRFIPGAAQDVRAYFLALQYWLAGSEENMANLVRLLIERYADGPRRTLRAACKAALPVEYPEVAVYHPRMAACIADDVNALPRASGARATVGLLLMRSYVLAGNTGHYDGMIAALEARGLRVIPAFATGLDARPAIEKYFRRQGAPAIDAMISLTGFSLVGGPAYNDARSAEFILEQLDVPYIAAHPVEFQTIEQWRTSDRGLLPVESTIMVAIPELDGSTGPTVFGGRVDGGSQCGGCERRCQFPKTEGLRDMHVCAERAEVLAARVEKLALLRRTQRAQRKIGVVIFNFLPNAGNAGTAAFLGVFESLYNVLVSMKQAGYSVEPPATPDALRSAIIEGNAARFGSLANVHARIPADQHVRKERWLADIEQQWGAAPGRHQTDGSTIHVYGERFGNVFVGVQPAFGYEGDPMRLLFERGFAPTHAFSAFYRWLREDFGADAVLHFGTHGALEFMPGKQVGLTGDCWPDRLIGNLPNFYLYAANNPSEGALAKRRSAATLISYLTPPVTNAGLYRGLLDLKASLELWRGADSDEGERCELASLIQTQAAGLDLANAEPLWADTASDEISRLEKAVFDLEYALIPNGLHVVGQPMRMEERAETLRIMAEATQGRSIGMDAAIALANGVDPEKIDCDAPTREALRQLAKPAAHLGRDSEIDGILRALDGRYINPAPGGDLLRTPDLLPTGRNLHGFDPFRIPSAFAVKDGARQAQKLIDRFIADGNKFPETIAMVLWGTDNLKSEGGPIAQALALMGASPRFDGYGRLAGANLLPLEELGRPRIDVAITLSGIFRDLLPLQIKLLAEAAFLAASADEPAGKNYIRKHALAFMETNGVDMEEASLRVFGNAEGAYGSNVNNLVDSGAWENDDDIAETYSRRKGFAFGRAGMPVQNPKLLASVLSRVDLAYQNLESVELGVTTVDNYFDTLGGITSAVKRARGEQIPVYIGDQTRGEGTVQSLQEQVALETRTRTLNPKWYEGMLKHGYEGVRHIETQLTNTMGWSATTGQVDPWVYQRLTQTFVLDPEMRERIAALNPASSVKIANRLIEAHQRGFWQPDQEILDALRTAGEDLEDRLEGVNAEIAA